MKKTLITGINGQDGSYLAEFLLNKGYQVHGILKRNSVAENQTARLNIIYNKITLHYADLTDMSSLISVIQKVMPDEIYNLAAQSHVRISFDQPIYTTNVTGLGTLNLLEAVKLIKPDTKIYQASSSEMFGLVQEIPQKETTPFYPRSPYGVAKVYSYWITKNYRESYGIHASNGILFNHESPRRGETFVTRKITRGLANIKLGLEPKLYLGNLDAKRDWGYAKDYAEGMWLMLQQNSGDDYVLATNETHTVREFCELAAQELGIALVWEGEGVNEVGKDKVSGQTIIEIDPKYFRPAEVDLLIGDYGKAKEKLNWSPRISFEELVKLMAMEDLEKAKKLKGFADDE